MQRQIDIMESSHEITYGLQEGGESSRVRSTLCRHQEIAYFLQEGENTAESDQHYAVIKGDHVRSAGRRRMQRQIDIM